MLRLALPILLLVACRSGPPRAPVNAASASGTEASAAAPSLFDGHYALDRPDAVFALPGKLREVSGLTWGPGGMLTAIDDEHGRLYAIDPATGAVTEGAAFGERGDYESVERVGERTFVLRSDGALFEDGRLLASGVPPGCDAEGLAHDAQAGRLLIACKGGAGGARAVYAFDLAGRRLQSRPAYAIPANPGRAPGAPAGAASVGRFRPSGLAFDAGTGDLYVVSANRPAVAVFRRDGTLRAAFALDASILPQPEGIAIGPDGTLYVASEKGNGRAPRLAVFRRR